MSIHRDLLLAAIALTSTLFAANAVSAPITVTETADGGSGSLREAIKTANQNVGADVIDFAIPDPGVQTIVLTSPLDTIEDELTIDGYTQPGAQPNTADTGSNAVILIELDGASAGANALGLGICAPNVTIRGLAIRGFDVAGIGVGLTTLDDACKTGAADGTLIAGNFIGLGADGDPGGDQAFGIRVYDSSVQIGGEIGDRNVIADNAGPGVELQQEGVKNSLVVDNLIGLTPELKPDGNKGAGVAFGSNAAGVTIGAAKQPNRIANNGIGIFVPETASRDTFFANDIGPNGDLDIDLCPVGLICPDGATPNDADDDDPGGNTAQNSPVLSKVEITAIDVAVVGELDVPASVAGADYVIALYWSPACAAAGIGPGEVFIGTAIANLSDAVQEFEITVEGAVPEVGVLTATATDPDGNTSEFSTCRGLPGIFRDSFE